MLDGSNLSIRRILNELRPVILDEYGLMEALKWQGQKFTANTGVPIEFNETKLPVKVAEEIAMCIFRIYQESLTNITRYANAKNVFVSLNTTGDNLALTIRDNGKGFNTNVLKNKKSFGILGMTERVIALNGHFELTSAPGKGTQINVSIPLKTQNNKLA